MIVDEIELMGRLREVGPMPTEVSERAKMVLRAAIAVDGDTEPEPIARHRARARRSRVVVMGVTAVVALAVGIGFAVAPSHPTTGALTHPPSRSGIGPASGVRARLLAALDAASGDVVGTESVLANGGSAERWADADNTRSVETVFAADGLPLSENLTTWSETTGTTSITIYPATRTWHETTEGPNGPRPIAPPSIRQQVADGVYFVVATGQSVDGHTTIELSSTSDDHVTSYLWVDSSTYLPVRESNSGGVGVPTGEVNWTYLPPSPSALAKLQLTVPAGYTQVSCPPSVAPNTCPASS